MLQITPHMRLMLVVEPVDFRKGIDGLAGICRPVLQADPFTGTLFVFRNKNGTPLKLLGYDGQLAREKELQGKKAKLAPRELQIVHSIRQNKSSKLIVDRLHLSVRTIESYREKIRKKLGIANQEKSLNKFITSLL